MSQLAPNQFELPACVTKSPDYQALSAAARHEFAARIKYISEIPQRISELEEMAVIDDWLFALDNIELACLVNLSIRSEPKGNVTPWLLHTSWTFECTTRSLAKSIEAEFKSLVTLPIPGFDATQVEIVAWVSAMKDGLDRELKNFQSALDFSNAVGALIKIDIILTLLIAGFAKAKFNINLRK